MNTLRKIGRVLGRCTRVLAAVLVVTAIVLWVCVRYGGLLEHLVERELRQRLGQDVSVGRVDLHANGSVEVFDVTVGAPDEEVVQLDRVRLQFAGLPGSALERVEADDAELTIRENEHGLEPRWLFEERAESGARSPRIELRGGRVRFLGDGPIHRMLQAYIADPSARVLQVERLEVTRADAAGLVELHGEFSLIPELVLEVVASGSEEAGIDVEFHVPRDRPIDLGAEPVRASLAPVILEWLDQNQIRGPILVEGEFSVPSFLTAASREPTRDLLEALHVEVELLGVGLEPGVFPCPLESLRGRLVVRGRNLEIHDLEGWHREHRVWIDGVIEDLPGEHRARVRSQVRSGRVTEELRAALSRGDVGRKFLEAFRPAGRFDVVTRLETRADSSAPDGVSAKLWHDVDLLDAEVCYYGYPDPDTGRMVGFPLRLRHLRGKVRTAPGSIEFEDVVGRSPSGALVTVDGELRWPSRGAEPEGAVSARALDLPVDRDFIDACAGLLGDDVRAQFERYGIEGTADFFVTVEAGSGARSAQVTVELRPKDLKFQHANFPLPLRLHSGTIVIADERIEFRSVGAELVESGDRPDRKPIARSAHKPTSVLASGWIGLGEDAGTLELDIEGHHLPVDERVRDAFAALAPATTERMWTQFEPSGSVDAFLHWKITADDLAQGLPGRCVIGLEPRGASLHSAEWGVTLADLEGRIQAEQTVGGGWRLTLHHRGLQASVFGGRVSLVGELFLGLEERDRAHGSLALTGERWRVSPTSAPNRDDTVFQVAHRLFPEQAELLDTLRPSGWLRFHCELDCDLESGLRLSRLSVGPDRPPNLGRSALADDDGLLLRIPSLTRAVRWRGGLLTGDVESGKWSFDRLDAQIHDADLQLRRGTVQWRADGAEVVFGGYLGSVPFEQLLAPLFGEQRRQNLRRLRLVGMTHTTLEEVRLFLPTAANLPSVMKVDAHVDLSHCGMRSGGVIQGLDGLLHVHLNYSDRPESVRPAIQITGELENASLLAGGLQVTGVAAHLVLTEDVLEVREIEGEYAGGRMIPAETQFSFPLTGEEPFTGAVTARGMEISRLLERTHGQDLAGRVDAKLDLVGRGVQLHELEARAVVDLRNGQLWSVPVMDNLYRYGISQLLGQDEPPRFERGQLEVQLQRGILHVPRVWLASPGLELEGLGAMGPQRLDFHFFPEVQVDLPLIDLPIVGPMIHWMFSKIERKAFSFRFEGPYSDPRVQWDPVRRRPPEYQGIAELDRPRLSRLPPLTRRERF